uniref:Uncharacterized protein n=1 Tax=Rhizophora mucronata TaxID=61149 RepID=A0A2P2JRK8_RHIMU
MMTTASRVYFSYYIFQENTFYIIYILFLIHKVDLAHIQTRMHMPNLYTLLNTVAC